VCIRSNSVRNDSKAAIRGATDPGTDRSTIGTTDSSNHRRKKSLEFVSGNRRLIARHRPAESDQHVETDELSSFHTKRFANESLEKTTIDSPGCKPSTDYDSKARATSSVPYYLDDETFTACAVLGP
jgi:hypothetical protein